MRYPAMPVAFDKSDGRRCTAKLSDYFTVWPSVRLWKPAGTR